MFRTASAQGTTMPDHQDPALILLKLEAQIYRIKNRNLIIREKIAHYLARARKKKNTDVLSVGIVFIAILDAIYDSFLEEDKRMNLIIELDLLLKMLRRDKYSAYRNSAASAFTHYFEKTIKKHEKLPVHFLPWFEKHVKHWEVKNVFGEGFSFDRCKLEALNEQSEVLLPKHHNLELLKKASIQLLEEYLSGNWIAADRLNNAEWLIYQIKSLPADASAFEVFQEKLNLAKREALEWDASINKDRFSFFRRNRFGSRYISLLDDLRERVLFCQCETKRKSFQQREVDDYRILNAHHSASVDDDHASHYLAKQVAHKLKFFKSAFGADMPVDECLDVRVIPQAK